MTRVFWWRRTTCRPEIHETSRCWRVKIILECSFRAVEIIWLTCIVRQTREGNRRKTIELWSCVGRSVAYRENSDRSFRFRNVCPTRLRWPDGVTEGRRWPATATALHPARSADITRNALTASCRSKPQSAGNCYELANKINQQKMRSLASAPYIINDNCLV